MNSNDWENSRHGGNSGKPYYFHPPPPPAPPPPPNDPHTFQPPQFPRQVNPGVASSNSAPFIAGLGRGPHLLPKPYSYTFPNFAGNFVIQCNYCLEPLTGRPRVHCLDCLDYDSCSACYHFGLANQGHQSSHNQEVLHSQDPPVRRPLPHNQVTYRCDFCHLDLSKLPRAHCRDCKNYDLCLDCLLVGEVSLKHKTSHDVNIITSHFTSNSMLLMDDSFAATPLLEEILEAVFDYIDGSFAPLHTRLIEAPKLSAFYSRVGVPADLNVGRISNKALATEYSGIGCEYYLVSDSADAINARKKPWTWDGIDTTPRTPALTCKGWLRFFIINSWEDPDLMHFILDNALSTGEVLNKKGTQYMLSIPRDSFPKEPHRNRPQRQRSGKS